MANEYDAVLAVLPIPLLASGLLAGATAVSTAVSLAVGSLLAVIPLLYTLFVAPPT
ncbi:hypothetical protein [Natronomonas sp. EA1]|uniref:hypothetical protein n=1 Tax=Natronomonas sp. EA1 TaxID=3421655 RepID=UPI003EBC7188